MAGASLIITPRYSYVVRSSTVYHSSTVYERASFSGRSRGVTGPAGSGMLGGVRSGSERAGGARVKADGGGAVAVEAPGATEAHGTDEYDEEPWPSSRYPRQYPRSGPSAREAAREDRIA